jgi:hypothetical protein
VAFGWVLAADVPKPQAKQPVENLAGAVQPSGSLDLQGPSGQACVSIDLKTGQTTILLHCDAGGAVITSVVVEDAPK